ncbi:unnamed protein product, partial [Iphiclides podalirius]
MSSSRQTSGLDARKINAELLRLQTFTNGASVSQMLEDTENSNDIDKRLERLEYRIAIHFTFCCLPYYWTLLAFTRVLGGRPTAITPYTILVQLWLDPWGTPFSF